MVFVWLVCFSSLSVMAIWPMPASFKPGQGAGVPFCASSLQVSLFAPSAPLPLLQQAVDRFQSSLFLRGSSSCQGVSSPLPLSILVSSSSLVLSSVTDESYSLSLAPGNATISATSVFGAMHGLESLLQLCDRSNPVWTFPPVLIVDRPRFPFRGFLHDTARHFLSMSTLKTLIDALAASKFNVFHWHIVDDESAPYVSSALPNLTKGAFGGLASHTYSQQNVQDIIQYAYARGIRVVPEFDTPGHVGGMGVGYPSLVTPCYTDGKPNGQTGPLNPILQSNYAFMSTLWGEVSKVFMDDFVHLGGDEVPFGCWESNPTIQAFMAARNWTDYSLLEQYYEQQLISIVEATGKKYIVWQEIFDNGLKIDRSTIVDVWKDSPWQDELNQVTQAGFGAILSAPWYLNYIKDPYQTKGDWESFYQVEPLSFNGTLAQHSLVLGGEGTMWGEFVDNTNVVSRTWPRAAAVGERLWSPREVTDLFSASERLHEFTCELLRRGIAAEPVLGPGYCVHEFQE